MENQITIREAVTENDIAIFWDQLHAYFRRDIFSEAETTGLAYCLGPAYRDHMLKLHRRAQDRCYFLFFHRNGHDIGFAMPVIYTTEDGKCFIVEYCVYPEFRGNGTGRECASVLLNWARGHGALYAELNYGRSTRRRHFWESVGFIENGADEWGEPLMILPPAEDIPISIDVLSDPEDWQIKKLENGFKREIGEEALTEEKQQQLQQAIRDGKISFFVARRGYRAVGMCSVAKCNSTFLCEDLYVEPAFRGKGIAKKLIQAAQAWCRDSGISGFTVLCF